MSITILNCILLLLILFIFYISNRFIKHIKKPEGCNDYKIYKKILYSNIKNDIKTGDLLFFDHNLLSIYERTFGHRQFSHIGIVVKINGILYSYDINPKIVKYNIFNNMDNISLVPLYERISNYCGDVFLVSLKNKLDAAIENDFISKINKTQYKYLSKYKIIFSFLFNSRFIYKNEKICSEFIAEILDELKITNNIQKSKKEELTSNIINLSNINLYYNPIHIILDDLIIKNLDYNNYKIIGNI